MTIGHNSVDKAKLKSFKDRRIALEELKQEAARDIRELNAEAKEAGIDVAALTMLVKEEMRDAEKAEKAARIAETLDQYKAALGMLEGTPLGRAAMERAGIGA